MKLMMRFGIGRDIRNKTNKTKIQVKSTRRVSKINNILSRGFSEFEELKWKR